MTVIYAYFAECDKCGTLGGPYVTHGQAQGVASNHNANKHKGVTEAYAVTEKLCS